MRKPNLNTIIENNLDKTRHVRNVTKSGLPNKKQTAPLISNSGYMQGLPPAGSHYRIPSDTLYNPTPYRIKATPNVGPSQWLEPYTNENVQFPGASYVDEQHYDMGGYISNRAKATQFGQYKMGGGMFPPYHSYTPPRMARGGISGSTYEIQPGDTLGDIAERSGISIAELAALNNIKDVDRIYANQTLNLGTNANKQPVSVKVSTPAKDNRPAVTPVNSSLQNLVSVTNFKSPAKPAVKTAPRTIIQPTAKPVGQSVANPSAFKGNYVKGQRLANWKDSRNLESGVITDKGTNTQYVVQNGNVVKSYPVMTGVAGKNKNTDVNKNIASTQYLEDHREARSTPTGTYFMKPDSEIYGYPGYDLEPIPAFGYSAPEAKYLSMHIPFGTGPKGSEGYDPVEGAKRLRALATPTPADNYGSWGCINTPTGELKCLTQNTFPQGDTSIVVDSRFAKDKNFLKNKFNVEQPRKMGGQPCYECGGMYAEGGDISIPDLQEGNWLDKYQIAGTVIPGVTDFKMTNPATESTSHSFYNPALGKQTNTSTTGYPKPVQVAPKKRNVAPIAANNFSNPLGRNVSSSTQAPPLYNPAENKNINLNSNLGKQQQQTLINAGQTPTAARYAVGNKKFTGNQQEILNKNAQFEYRVTHHPNYNPNKSIYDQRTLADDNSLVTRINRGSRAEASDNPLENLVSEVMYAPGRGFNNIFLEKNNYKKQGWTAPLNFGLDVISMAPGIGEGAASGIRGLTSKAVLGNALHNVEGNILKNAVVSEVEHEIPAFKQLGHHFVDMGEEAAKHKAAHAGVHSMASHDGGHGEEENINFNYPQNSPFSKMKAFKNGGWLNKYL